MCRMAVRSCLFFARFRRRFGLNVARSPLTTLSIPSRQNTSDAPSTKQKEKADALLIQLRTPGGLVDSTRSIIEKILASDVPVVVYVTPSGGYAASQDSSFWSRLTCGHVAGQTPEPRIRRRRWSQDDEVLKQKMENDAAALMRSFVSKRGRNVEVAESAVLQSKSFTEQEALDRS